MPVVNQNSNNPITIITPNGSFSGSDITVYAAIDLNDIILNKHKQYKLEDSNIFQKLGNIQTMSYSVYRDKSAVNVLGRTSAKGFARGYVTIAGTIIFTVLRERVLSELLKHSFPENEALGKRGMSFENMRIDQLPPLDLFLTMSNELGFQSRLSIFGVEFMNEGQVHSVQDLFTENSVNYIARHLSPLREVGRTEPIGDDDLSDYGMMGRGTPLSISQYQQAAEEIKQLKKIRL